MNKKLSDLQKQAYMMCTPVHSADGWVRPEEFAEHLSKLIIDECCERMEYAVPDRTVPRPTWQLYEHFGLEWKTEWETNEYGQWVKKK